MESYEKTHIKRRYVKRSKELCREQRENVHYKFFVLILVIFRILLNIIEFVFW
jgi:hypothetical protein